MVHSLKTLSLIAILALTAWNAYATNETGPANSVLRVPPAGGRATMGKVNLASPAAVVSPLPTLNGGLGHDASADTGVQLFATGTATVTATTGTGNIVRSISPTFTTNTLVSGSTPNMQVAATSPNTGQSYFQSQNANTVSVFGTESSAGTGFGYSGATAYATVVGNNTSVPVQIATSGTVRASFNTSGGLSFSDSTKGIVGTATNDAATASYVGEFASVNSPTGGSATVAASGSFSNITSMSLTAGDWDCEGTLHAPTAGFTGTRIAGSVSKSSAAQDSTVSGGFFSLYSSFPSSGDHYFPTGVRRISLASTSTVYLVGSMVYTVIGSVTWGTGSILQCRRVR